MNVLVCMWFRIGGATSHDRSLCLNSSASCSCVCLSVCLSFSRSVGRHSHKCKIVQIVHVTCDMLHTSTSTNACIHLEISYYYIRISRSYHYKCVLYICFFFFDFNPSRSIAFHCHQSESYAWFIPFSYYMGNIAYLMYVLVVTIPKPKHNAVFLQCSD